MEHPTNSRFITYPSTVDKSSSHTVVLIDAGELDIENIGLFCKVSNKNYDIYLYRNNGDLEWLSYVSSLADTILIKDSSAVNTSTATRLTDPLVYFEKFDQI